MNLVEDLKKAGIELTAELEKKYAGEFVSRKEMDTKLEKAEAARKDLEERLETAESTLKDFEGKDFEGMTKQVQEWQQKYNELVKTQKENEAARVKTQLLDEAFSKYEFTSEAAKRSIYNDIAADVVVKDGQLIGFNDLMSAKQKADASAFVTKADKQKAKFTEKFQNSDSGQQMPGKKEFLKSLGTTKSAAERQAAIRENIGLFTEQ